MCDSPPMIMFCGLPVSVAVEPMLAASARPIRCGRGSRRNWRARCSTSGVRARQTTSLTSIADSTAESPIVAASRPSGRLTRASATPARRSKKPARRRKATTTIMPSSKAMVAKSMAATASSKLRTPVASIPAAPTQAMPARSIRSPGSLPRASPAYVSVNQVRVSQNRQASFTAPSLSPTACRVSNNLIKRREEQRLP